MRRKRIAILSVLLLAGVVVSDSVAQYGRGRGRGRWDDDWGAESARQTRYGQNFPTWEVDADFPEDVFTFVRVRYGSAYGYGRGGGGGWRVDFPQSELNFSLRLQQLTSLKVNPDPIILDLTDPKLFDYPFIYMIEPGRLMFREAEIVALRKYLENGGFLMVDDFWGEDEWQNFYHEIKRVFPNREPEEVPLEHPIFQCVYPMTEKPQVPAVRRAGWGGREQATYERGKWYGPNHDTDPHYRAITDDAGRIMVFICHNTDLGDGWEREGDNEWYFQEFSVKKSYPLGINIVTYALTH